MTVNHEIKTQLARLLATENFVVEHRDVRTASFNVYDRVLVLPLWKLASNTIYDLLVAHECSHALFTPNEDWTEKVNIPKQFVNVVEDIRIEKLMKRKYPGLSKTFYNGYQELNDADFFDIVHEDINTFNLADRINLHFKVGHFVDVAFSTFEEPIVRIVEGCETFDDVLFASELLYKFCKKDKEKGEDTTNEKVDSSPTSEEESKEDPVENDVEEEEEKEEPEIKTDNALSESIGDLNDPTDHVESVYCEIPKLDLGMVIVSNSDIHNKLDFCFEGQLEDGCGVDDEYYKFKKVAQKEVNYLVKEFECKKASDNYARATTNRTGVLDTKKLSSYRFNEDLFKKVSIVPDGKNHGLIFLLDWSGSMSPCMMDTVKQLYNLIWFCRKVQIPFEVYAFTTAYNKVEKYDSRGNSIETSNNIEKRENVFRVGDEFKLLNWLSSKVSKATLEEHMVNFWRVASFVSYARGYAQPLRHKNPMMPYLIPPEFYLSGTPLHEAIVSLHQIIPQFKRQNKLQKVQCIILTDGEANPLPIYRYTERRFDVDSVLRPKSLHANRAFLRSRKTGHVYNLGYRYWDFTQALLKDIKDTHSDVNFIGIRLLAGKDFGGFIKRYCPDTSEDIIKRLRKLKSVTIRGTGYHSYFGILSSGLYEDPEFEVKDDATKAQIKSAFVKSLKTKKLNKKVLGEFISLVA